MSHFLISQILIQSASYQRYKDATCAFWSHSRRSMTTISGNSELTVTVTQRGHHSLTITRCSVNHHWQCRLHMHMCPIEHVTIKNDSYVTKTATEIRADLTKFNNSRIVLLRRFPFYVASSNSFYDIAPVSGYYRCHNWQLQRRYHIYSAPTQQQEEIIYNTPIVMQHFIWLCNTCQKG